MRCVRIKFNKTGRVKYVSHLDVMRAITRAVRRAKIPLWYTEGFNPHPYLNFLQPLPLGIEGFNEPLDIRIEGEIENREIKERLNGVLPEGFEITSVTEPYMKSNDIAFGEYEIIFEREPELSGLLEKAMSSGGLVCEKTGKVKGKKVIKEVNISENIKEYSIKEEDNAIILNVILPCGNTKNVNPVNLLSAVWGYIKKETVPVNIKRLRLTDINLMDFE